MKPHNFKIIHIILIAAFVGSSLYLPQSQANGVLSFMPTPGTMVNLSPKFTPAIIRGMTIDVRNPFAFTFLIDRGDRPIATDQKKELYEKLIKYFLAAMTIAEDKQWVNLSPYEKNRIIDINFGKTEMGRDLLAQDYMLKQLTSSLLYPENAIGKEFWNKIYTEASHKYGTTNIPINTFNKVWITPDKASVYEKDRTVLIVESKLKVQLEKDYLATEKNHEKQNTISVNFAKSGIQYQNPQDIAKNMMLEIVIPALTKEVNEGENFANLRQMFHGMILATWYKQALKKSILTQVYANKNKVQGVNLADPEQDQQEVYQQYVKAFRKGVYNFIKEDQDPITGQMIPRKYFSGGFSNLAMASVLEEANPAQAAAKFDYKTVSRLDAAQAVIAATGLNSNAAMTGIGFNSVVLRKPDTKAYLRVLDKIVDGMSINNNRVTVRLPKLSSKAMRRLGSFLGLIVHFTGSGLRSYTLQDGLLIMVFDKKIDAAMGAFRKLVAAMMLFAVGAASSSHTVHQFYDNLHDNSYKMSWPEFGFMAFPICALAAVFVGSVFLILQEDLDVKIALQIYKRVRADEQIRRKLALLEAEARHASEKKSGQENTIGKLVKDLKGRFRGRVDHYIVEQIHLIQMPNIREDEIEGVKTLVTSALTGGDYVIEYLMSSNGSLTIKVRIVDAAMVQVKQNEVRDNDLAEIANPVTFTKRQIVAIPEIRGGIDFDPMGFKLRRDGSGVPLPLSNQDPAMMNVQGLEPHIWEIQPATNLSIFKNLRVESQAQPA